MGLNARVRSALTIAVAAAAVAATGAAASVPAVARAVPAPLARPAPPQVTHGAVLLVTGERLAVTPGPDGRVAILDLRAASGHDSSVILRLGTVTEDIPADALPYLGRGLDPSLFDLAALQRSEAGGRLPVRVTFEGRTPHLPGVTISRSGTGTAEGYLTVSSARAFGAALERQFRRDHASGAYGGGLFAGDVNVTLAGAPAPPVRPDFPMHTLTVTASDLSGKPDNGDPVWVFDASNVNDFYENTGSFYRGVAKFSVPTGHYWVIGEFDSSTAAGAGVTRLDFLPQVSVGHSVTVHAAARAATSEITMVTPRPAVPVDVTFSVNLTDPLGSTTGVEWFNAPGQIWVSPTHLKPAVGALQALATQQLVSPGAPQTPFVYNLDYADPAGIIPPQRYLVRSSNLATVTERYFQDVPSTGEFFTFGAFPGQSLLAFVLAPLALPGTQIQYFSTAATLRWQDSYFAALGLGQGGQADDAWRLLRPGAQEVDWNRYPLHPQPNVSAGGPATWFPPLIPSAIRAGNTLTLTVFPFSDNEPGHFGAGSVGGTKVTERYEVDQNGARISGGSAFNGVPDVTLSGKPSVIRFTLDAARTGPSYVLSPRSHTVWTWRSRRQPAATVPQDWYCSYVLTSQGYEPVRRCAVQPMMTLAYQVHGMALNGSVPAGPQLIDLRVGHIQLARAAAVSGATAQVSCDGGRSWRRAAVRSLGGGRFRLAFSAPGGCDVTLRVSAADAAGGSIAQTITRAYAVG